jgi:hypothetical protein
MITRHDEQLLSSLRFAGAPPDIPLQASHTDISHTDTPHTDETPKVHLDHGPLGTPDHTDGQVDDPARHNDKEHGDSPHEDVDQGIARASANPAPEARADQANADALIGSRLDAFLGRMEDILLAREQQLHRDVGIRLDAFVSEMTSVVSNLRSESGAIEQRLAALERNREIH